MEVSALKASFVTALGNTEENQDLMVLAKFGPDELQPVRKPKSHKNHRHIPGEFWLSKLKRSVTYESRLEMVILKQLDFDPLLVGVLPQPFVLSFAADGTRYRHIPDFLAWRKDCCPLLIDVKPKKYIDKERNKTAFEASRAACSRMGWEYAIESEPSAYFLANLNWLAGFRREPPNFNDFAEDLIERAMYPITISDLLRGFANGTLTRPTLFYLMWSQVITFNMTVMLSDSTMVCLAGRAHSS